jgi:sugar phosphate isomerase/epimerase
MPQRLSFQLYCAREYPPVADTIAMLARIGYREVEGYGGVYQDPKALRATLDKHGITMPTGHFSIEALETDRATVLSTAQTLGMRHIYCPYLTPDQRPTTAAGWTAFGERLAKAGAWVRSEGYTFGWHNHDFEYIALPTGEMPHDMLFAAAPMMDWECDVAWIVRANADPLPWIKKYGDRITTVHVKDIAPKGECLNEDGWADVGQGTMDWNAHFAALKHSRTVHYVMEHDKPSDLERFAKRSFDYVSKI